MKIAEIIDVISIGDFGRSSTWELACEDVEDSIGRSRLAGRFRSIYSKSGQAREWR
jgi:hypothetical protein